MWRFRLLGDIALSSGGRQVRRLRANKYAFVLAYFCIHSGRAFSREVLIAQYWPDSDLDLGRSCLRTAMASLRRQLDAPDLFLEGSRALVLINRDLISTDVSEFEEAVRQNSPEAATLYGGEFLPGCYDDWAMLERMRLELLYEEVAKSPRRAASEPASKVQPFRSSIPSPTSLFCGRACEVEELLQAVVHHRLVSLIGLGGMGKTRIAIETGRILRDRLRVFFLDLAKVKETFEINGVAAGALGIARAPFETLEERLSAELSVEPTLLIMDNFEHLLESKDGPEWVEQKLGTLDSLKIVVTSRRPLDLEGERILALEPMGIEDAREMFLDRARSVLPDFPRSELLDALCRRLDGMPLAIVLCAARANVLTAKAMLSSLDHRFEVLQSDRRSIDQRQSSLRTVLEWSCPTESPLHSALSSLAVFTGSWTLEATSAILGNSALGLLAGLRQRSLVRVDAAPEENRFSMLDAVREYALETGNLETIDASKAAHSDYYLCWSRRLVELHSTDEWASFRGFDAESPNIFAAFEYGLNSNRERELETLRTIQFAGWALWVRGYGRSLLDMYRLSESSLSTSKGIEAQARHLRLSAEAAGHRGENELAIERLDKAADQFLSLDLRGMASDCMKAAAGFCLNAEDWQGAVDRYSRQISTLDPDDHYAKNVALASLAHAYLLHGDFDRAQTIYRDLKIYWKSQPASDGHMAMIDRGLSACLASTGRPEEAISILEKCVAVFRRMGLRYWEIKSWEDLNRLYRSIGDLERSALADKELQRLQREA